MFDPLITYKKEIFKNQLVLNRFLNKIKASDDIDKKLELVSNFSYVLTAYPTDRYVMSEIEEIYTDFAKTLPKVSKMSFEENSVLHVMTEPYTKGGHTRVVERWIEQAPRHEKHSVVFTKTENGNASIKIKKLVLLRGGVALLLPQDEHLNQKSLILRRLASSYQTIVLHTHPHDYIPLVAFGSNDFTRPIVIFNHADHVMWYGITIADIVAEFRTWGMKLTQNKRGCDRSFLIGLPQDISENKTHVSKQEARKILNLPLDDKIILTIGMPPKYKALPALDFSDLAQRFLDLDNKNHVICIGISPEIFSKWDNLQKKHTDRFELLGTLERDNMFLYIAACDIVIDSFPMSGCIALMDALSYDRPVLSLECPVGQSDFILQSPAYCASMDELVKKATIILKSTMQCDFHTQSVKKYMEEDTSATLWQERVQQLHKLATMEHRVYPCAPDYTGLNALMDFVSKNNIQDIDNVQDKALGYAFNEMLSELYTTLDVYRFVMLNPFYTKCITEQLEKSFLE